MEAIYQSVIDNGLAQDGACGFIDSSGDSRAGPLVFANSAAVGGDDSCDTAAQ